MLRQYLIRMNRKHRQFKFLFSALLIVLLLQGASHKVYAATITVTTTDDSSVSQCTLRDAITSTNNNVDSGACVGIGGYGNDTINVPAGTFLLGSSLPTISDSGNDIGIIGAGRGDTIIDADSNQYQCINIDSSMVNAEVTGLTCLGSSVSGIRVNAGGTKVLDNVAAINSSAEGIAILSGTGDTSATDIVSYGNAEEGFSVLANSFTTGTITIDHAVLHDNGVWAIGIQSDGPVSITNSTIYHNIGTNSLSNTHYIYETTYFDGTGTYTIQNTTVADNVAGDASNPGFGGLTIGGNGNTQVYLTNVTIANNRNFNSSLGVVDGIGMLPGTAVFAKNVLLANNGAGNCGGTLFSTPLPVPTSLGGNLSDDGTCTDFTQTKDQQNTDPKIGTGTIDGSTYVIPLLANSPAIDAGVSSGAPATDQRGTVRPQSSGIDIGAYESVLSASNSNSQSNSGGSSSASPTLANTGQSGLPSVIFSCLVVLVVLVIARLPIKKLR